MIRNELISGLKFIFAVKYMANNIKKYKSRKYHVLQYYNNLHYQFDIVASTNFINNTSFYQSTFKRQFKFTYY